MRKTVIIYGVALALCAAALQWLDYRHTLHAIPTPAYVSLVALGFTLLGGWIGHSLTQRAPAGVDPGPRHHVTCSAFEPDEHTLRALGISQRQYQVLTLLAEGHSNRQIAEQLFVSPNTVKTHLAQLYAKLEVCRRTQAVRQARSLHLLP